MRLFFFIVVLLILVIAGFYLGVGFVVGVLGWFACNG
jgi:hypothetical protein